MKIKSETETSPASIVLTGAGASARFGIPTMKNFLDGYELAKSLPLRLATARCKSLHNDEIDLEEIMFFLQSLEDMDVNDLHAFPVLEGVRGLTHVPRFEQIKQNSLDSAEEIRAFIHEKCSTFESGKVWKSYLPLFKYLAKKNSGQIVIFTTNYDVTLEELFFENSGRDDKILPDLFDGFLSSKGLGGETWAPDEFDKNLHEGAKGLFLIKLHGSLGWRRHPRQNDVIMKTPAAEERSQYSVIIYPTKIKKPISPFDQLYKKFGERLVRARELIIIGCSLRDSYLYDCISEAYEINSTLKIRLCSPSAISVVSELKPLRLTPYQVRFGTAEFNRLLNMDWKE